MYASIPSFSSSSLVSRALKPPKPSSHCLSFKTLTLTCTSQPKPKKRATTNAPKPTSKSNRKPSYGTSRRSVLKKTFNQEQVMFSAPVSNDPVVAIIGGGMAGLICALSLEKRGVRSTVFDTGIHGLGGRMGTRIIDPWPLIFDHAAQFFTVNDSRFAELVDCWLEKGLIEEWQGIIGELDVGGLFSPFPSSLRRYVGVNGMRPLADSLLSETCLVNVVRPCWISKLEPFNGMWHLSENGKPCGEFDAIVIAHNGKCANRLLATSGLPLIARQMKRLELSSIWALLAAFEDPLPLPGGAVTSFEGAFVKGVDSVSWMANNTKKLLRSQSSGPHCWTFLSTAAYGKRNKVPQENIPTATAEKVKAGMLEGVEAALGLSKGSLKKPLYTRVQLWIDFLFYSPTGVQLFPLIHLASPAYLILKGGLVYVAIGYLVQV
ncbi:renalase isoform X2 [Juglans microcarpa x Juglans regia]|uniref:renalase isoform X2 n=1 Tax=Juglans microcarpa x Juglans regia TaxID=2249226 RepID=UPI001B7DE33A|nr:renalase isoform X2 [Juglans microcarpa x Juglans regia]